MHSRFFAILMLSASMAFAIEPVTMPNKSSSAGFLAYQTAEQKLSEIVTFEKSIPANVTGAQRKKQISDKTIELQNQAYDQCKISIASFQTAPAESIDVSAVYFCLVNAIENCQTPSIKPNCNSTIQAALQIAQKQLANQPEAIGLQNLIGHHYARQKRYSQAMQAYYPAYMQFSKAPCSRNHANQLVTILNLQLENGDQNGFNQYWKISSYCETSGLIQPRGAKFVRDASANRVTLTPDPSLSVASTTPATAPVIPRELPAKVQAKPEPVQIKVAAPKKVKPETDDAEESESEEDDIIASAELMPPEAKPAAAKIPSVRSDVAELATNKPEVDTSAEIQNDPPQTAAKVITKAKEDSNLREPAVASEVFKSIQEFVPGLLIGIAKNHPAWEASLTKRRANKNKSEKEARELEEIFKAKKENEKKAMDQMMSADPDTRAKQLKNVSRLRLGDSMDKIKAALGKPTAEVPDQRVLSYDHLATGATVGEVLEGKMPPFVALQFIFNPTGQLQEIKYSYPQGHGQITCR